MGMAAPQTLPGMAASLQVLAAVCLSACLPVARLSVCLSMSIPGVVCLWKTAAEKKLAGCAAN